ncbi:cupin domain-containing protein [Pseudidiomarina terrestris]|uniref:Cupin domain-containing protein n=1 Tax=Pseudidiomarina terrestris TaxID=2820060 RepID=A0AAW7QTU5_9GAMM|nr:MULTISPECIES: cupin domain-containing protein [unclassified Pseudidiomarina]MDN7123665.1 cupin domain-containing protein [Pseudidiomarina sp. 1APP75-32.1]MDN7126545.1 cupin domain-containing protein [Pseudidiomarina sp. 1APR75-33.1]MDN7128611.1 cupin domain-containing protein [Pseudidiomarina sp. 1APR75-15]MDN7135130.1 cupin domain-containing protein [Pseudidiomarina sp. 1ASP75-5]MDN7137801.1 cupin domain-containing protein [Pseudidiomarina sp. 1ASP75-14]
MSFELRIDRDAFLRDYWQQRPLLMRAALADFDDPIAPELLAGLAMEEGVDARVIAQQDATWDVEHGPFTDYERFGEEGWTLLVQAVNEWFPDVQNLLLPFRFLPDWRLDDVMVSFATEHGSVGAHLDQYDVFIIQGAGQRHWRVGERDAGAEEFCPHPDLKQIRNTDFTACIDAVLQPGDVLYIPAGCPHHGVALEPSLNYSIGFRAPNTAEWLAQLADQLLASEEKFPRYQDPKLDQNKAPYEIAEREIENVQQLLLEQLKSASGVHAIQQVMSQSKRPLPQPEREITLVELASYASTDMLVCRTPGARLLLGCDGKLYANGDCVAEPDSLSAGFTALLELDQEVALAECDAILADSAALNCLAELLNQGVFHLIQELEDEATD